MSVHERVTGDAAPDLADLKRQMEALREEVARTAGLLRDVAGVKAEAVSTEAASQADALARKAADRGIEARNALDGAVRDHPLASVGVAALAGFLIGMASRR